MNFRSTESCVPCGKIGDGMTCFHHLLTKKVYPEFKNELWNLVSVCQKCHNEFHSKGTVFMAEKYPSVKAWLENHGWSICKASGKYKPDGF